MKKLSEILQKAKYVVLHYPLVLVMSLVMVIFIVTMIEGKYTQAQEFFHIKIIITSSLGISLMFALKMLSQRIGKSYFLHFFGLIFLSVFYFVLPKKESDFTEMYAFLLVPTYVLSHLLVAFTPFVRKGNSEKSFWQYNKNLFVNFFLTVVFTGVLTGGVELAILAVEQLFNFDFYDRIYAETFFVFSVFGSTFIFLLFNENGLDFLEKDGNYPVVLKFFTQFILIPLLFIYVVILYFYSVKILLAWELPRGWVSYLVLAYSVVGILALLLVHPLKDETAKSWVKVFGKIFYFSLIPLLILLFTAIFTRLLQYGFTEARYFVLLLALWLSGVVFYFVFYKRPSIKFIPVSLFLFGFFALIFPYLNTFSVAKRSQKKELQKLLIENNLLENGKINFNITISDSIADDIIDKFYFLGERHQQEYLDNFLNDTIKKELTNDQYRYWNIRNQFTNIERKHYNSNRLMLEATKKYYKVSDYQYIINGDLYDFETDINEDIFQIQKRFYGERPIFKLTLNNSETVDIVVLIKELFEKHPNKEGTVKVNDLFVEFDLENYHIKVVFDFITRTRYSNSDKDNYSFATSVFLIKEK